MKISANTWIGQVTTGHGFMLLTPTLLAALSGTMPWNVAFPLLVAGVVGLVWPENSGLKAASQTAAADLEKVYEAYRDNAVAAAANAPVPPDLGKTAANLAVLAAIGLSVTACAGQTPEQQAATLRGIECLADTTSRVAAVVAEPGDRVSEAAHASTAIGMVLAADPACNAAPVTPPPSVKP